MGGLVRDDYPPQQKVTVYYITLYFIVMISSKSMNNYM